MSDDNKITETPTSEDETIIEKEPSYNQPLLDRIEHVVKQFMNEEAIISSYINEMDEHLVCFEIEESHWTETAQLLKNHPELEFDYMRNLSGIDQETHLEVVYHLSSLRLNIDLFIKIKTDRDNPSIHSVTSVWPTANWNEREVYDLFGIHFPKHPNLRRIMMPDEWVGYPLRKDYVPIDPEV
jgi:NADH-quinone oxidoreductase subunit C